MSEGRVDRQLRTASWGLDSFGQGDLLHAHKERVEMLRQTCVFAACHLQLTDVEKDLHCKG